MYEVSCICGLPNVWGFLCLRDSTMYGSFCICVLALVGRGLVRACTLKIRRFLSYTVYSAWIRTVFVTRIQHFSTLNSYFLVGLTMKTAGEVKLYTLACPSRWRIRPCMHTKIRRFFSCTVYSAWIRDSLRYSNPRCHHAQFQSRLFVICWIYHEKPLVKSSFICVLALVGGGLVRACTLKYRRFPFMHRIQRLDPDCLRYSNPTRNSNPENL